MYQDEADAVKYSKGSLCVKGEPYRKNLKIVPPTPKQLIDLDADKLNSILKLNTKRSPKVMIGSSTFVGYVADVKSYQDINDAYIKVRMVQPEAKHVVCAYHMIDPEVDFSQETCYQMDYQDDGEPAAGRLILDTMNEYNVKHKAVFVARVYGGQKMGPNRFQGYAKAAKLALGLETQEIDTPETKPPPSFPSNNTRNSGPRGGG